MATLKMPFTVVRNPFKPSGMEADSSRAREFLRRSYERSGGPTPELKSVYRAFLENERKRQSRGSPET